MYDLKPEEPTYLFERGNELRPDKEHPLSPGVPLALGGALAVKPVELPILARYPSLRDFAIEEDLDAAARRVSKRESALKKLTGKLPQLMGCQPSLHSLEKSCPYSAK